MIVQAIALLDDLDKELNTYAMRVKEWYGWHFPEMGRIVNDNLAYARVILNMGMRSNAAKADLAEILPEEIEIAVKSAAEISMGTEITQEDLDNIQALAEQVVSFTEYRSQLSGYLSARMAAIAPNLTALVGDLVGARLIAHAGSLMNLAKSPASTLQILGAEKALFRALKTKHDTPKYGLIYHASLIGQATGKNKGKIARMLATKAALGLRVDALADWGADDEGKGETVAEEDKGALGAENRIKIERRLAGLEGKPLRSKGVAIAPNGISFTPGKWEVKEARKYNPDADGLAGDEPAAAAPASKKSKKSMYEQSNSVKLIEEVSEEPASKKAKKNKANGIKPIEEVVNDAMGEGIESSNEAEQESADDQELHQNQATSPIRTRQPQPTAKTNGSTENAATGADDKSETVSTVSADTSDSPPSPSPTQQELNRDSSLSGDTKMAKKARKEERHKQKKLKKEKIARRLDRKERRDKKVKQLERREQSDNARYDKLAEQAGLTLSRYKRKLERGEIKFVDGKPEAISKKDIKKARKAAEKAERATNENASHGKKRKRDEDGVEKSQKKKKKRVQA